MAFSIDMKPVFTGNSTSGFEDLRFDIRITWVDFDAYVILCERSEIPIAFRLWRHHESSGGDDETMLNPDIQTRLPEAQDVINAFAKSVEVGRIQGNQGFVAFSSASTLSASACAACAAATAMAGVAMETRGRTFDMVVSVIRCASSGGNWS